MFNILTNVVCIFWSKIQVQVNLNKIGSRAVCYARFSASYTFILHEGVQTSSTVLPSLCVFVGGPARSLLLFFLKKNKNKHTFNTIFHWEKPSDLTLTTNHDEYATRYAMLAVWMNPKCEQKLAPPLVNERTKRLTQYTRPLSVYVCNDTN